MGARPWTGTTGKHPPSSVWWDGVQTVSGHGALRYKLYPTRPQRAVMQRCRWVARHDDLGRGQRERSTAAVDPGLRKVLVRQPNATQGSYVDMVAISLVY